MLRPALRLDASRPAAAVRAQLEKLPSDTAVVVRRAEGWQTYWYAYEAGQILQTLRDWIGPPNTPLGWVLDLHEYRQSPAVDTDAGAEPRPLEPTVLLAGDQVLGVLVPDVQSQRGNRPVAPFSPNPAGLEPPPPAAAPQSPLRPPAPPFPDGFADAVPPAAAPAPDTGVTFEAYPQLDAPGSVAPGQELNLEVAFTREQPQGHRAELLTVADAPAVFTISAQVFAPGFDLLGAPQQDMVVQRDDLTTARASFRLRAQAGDAGPTRREITVQFSRLGQPLARAWRDVLVLPPGALAPPADPQLAATPATPAPPGAPVDLIVYVEAGRAEVAGELLWRLESPHPFTPPASDDLSSQSGVEDGKLFAAEEIRTISQHDGPLIQNYLSGLGKRIRGAMPLGLFQVLAEVWQAVRSADAAAVPSLLLISAELYVPWELAALEDDIGPELLDATRPRTLGAQCRVGRWVPPGRRTALSGALPPLPPPAAHPVGQRVVVIGNYGPESSYPALVQAGEEGRELVARWRTRAVAAHASPEAVRGLLNGTLEDSAFQPVRPTLLHFACHAAFDPTHPAYNGLILEDGKTRLNPYMVEGSQLGAQQAFVFLNACQAALPQQELSDAGGFARAFLRRGCVGFVAPLWNVDDGVARSFATHFYELVEGQGLPVAEALRSLRQPFASATPVPSSTLMAYTYYGHPDLKLSFQ